MSGKVFLIGKAPEIWNAVITQISELGSFSGEQNMKFQRRLTARALDVFESKLIFCWNELRAHATPDS